MKNPDRLIKRRLLAAPLTASIRPGPGCVRAVERELEELLGGLVTPGGVESGLEARQNEIVVAPIRYRSLLELTLRLTTAQDVSLVVGKASVHNRQGLETLLDRIDWRFYLRGGDGIFLRCDSRASALYHEGIIREAVGARFALMGVHTVKGPDAGEAGIVTVRLDHNRCTVQISLAGAPLWKRGYRASDYAPAPLREDLAQSAIRATFAAFGQLVPESPDPAEGSVSRPREAVFVPFSGSGTLFFEYLIARFRVAPFIFRECYAFERFPAGPPASVAWAKGKLLESLAARCSRAKPVIGRLVDRDPRAVTAAVENLRRFRSLLGAAGRRPEELPLEVETVRADLFTRPWRTFLPEEATRVFLPMNPPYGVRLAARSSEELYRRIGTATADLAAALPPGGLCGFVLCPTERSWQAFLGAAPRLEATTSHFSQGGLDIRLCSFRSRSAT